MRIIKLNNRVECNCGCVFEYDKSDIKIKRFSEIRNQLLFTRDYYKISYVCCPQCERTIELHMSHEKTI